MFASKLSADAVGRVDVLAAIRQRAMRATGKYTNDALAIRLALCCATREPALSAQYTFADSVVESCKDYTEYLAITADEFSCLFGKSAGLCEATPEDERQFRDTVERLQEALVSTLAEEDRRAVWASAVRRLAVSLSLHLVAFEALLPNVLGAPLRGDMRKLEDLRDRIESEPFDTACFNRLVTVLLRCAGVEQ